MQLTQRLIGVVRVAPQVKVVRSVTVASASRVKRVSFFQRIAALSRNADLPLAPIGAGIDSNQLAETDGGLTRRCSVYPAHPRYPLPTPIPATVPSFDVKVLYFAPTLYYTL